MKAFTAHCVSTLSPDSAASDLLMGVNVIARYLGITKRQVRYARETGSLPIRHKRGFGLYALKSELLDSLKDSDSLSHGSRGEEH